nr:4-alpha-glucanotransferase [Candidatus Goldiibacteriota bacterium]
EKEKFWKYLKNTGEPPEDATKQLLSQALNACSASRSIYCIQLIQDWLSIGNYYDVDKKNMRINVPGTFSEKNWSVVLPVSLDELLSSPVNDIIKEINSKTERT